MKRKTSHRLGRPTLGARNVKRMNYQGRWVEDTGARGKAFMGEAQLRNGTWIYVLWVDACECGPLDRCLARRAAEYAFSVYGRLHTVQLVVERDDDGS
jgi:hypothetical protein